MISSRLKAFAVDPVAVEEGRWFTYDEKTGIRFKIARIGNRAFVNEIARIKASSGSKTLDLVEVSKMAIAKTIVRDWEGLDDPGVEPRPGPVDPMDTVDLSQDEFWADGLIYRKLPYSPQRCLEILNDPAYGSLSIWIETIAGSEESFRAERVRTSLGN